MQEKDFLSMFEVEKPVIGVLHCNGNSDQSILDTAIREIHLYEEGGIDAILVENYFCEPRQTEMVLKYIAENSGKLLYGVNLLGDDKLNFKLANEYNCDFIQIDSVCGHLAVADDEEYRAFIEDERKSCRAMLIGGVRFKYQPYLSGRSLNEDLELGKMRCDALAVTSEGTGIETNLEKIIAFRERIGDFPLVIGAGVTPENLQEQLTIGDACIVGSYFKDEHNVEKMMNVNHIKKFMDAMDEFRKIER